MELIETFIVVTLHVNRTNIFYFLFLPRDAIFIESFTLQGGWRAVPK